MANQVTQKLASQTKKTITLQPKIQQVQKGEGFIQKVIKYVPGRGDLRFKRKDNVTVRMDWMKLFFLIAIPLYSIYGIFTVPFVWQTVVLSVLLHFLTSFGITGCYHRMYSHRAWNAVTPVRLFILIWAAAANQGSVGWWVKNHRAHHKFTDTSKDPYNVKGGFFYAHIGWLIFLPDPEDVGNADISDLIQDPASAFQIRYYDILAIFFGIIFPTLVAGYGWGDFSGGFFFASLLRMSIVHHTTFFVNSLAHYYGEQEYNDLQTAVDSQFTALLTMGEGYHNFHHEFPQDYRNGIKWFHYDPTKWIIATLYYLGLAYDLKKTPQTEIEKAIYQVSKGKSDHAQNILLFGENFNDNLPEFTRESIAQLSKQPNHLIVIISQKVYNVFGFLDMHPGGRNTMMEYAGQDVTQVFVGDTGKHIHSDFAKARLEHFLIGRFVE